MARRRPRVPTALLATITLALLVAAIAVGGTGPWAAPDTAEPADVPAGSARELLDTLTVSDHRPVDGYDADLYGWRQDTDRNGCDTRNDVLRRDLSDVRVKPGTHGCVVAAGTLASPYSGGHVQFVAGDNGGGVDIDHVVARENAWQSGASEWTERELVAFGNDPLNLLAVESSLNRSHGSRAADEWVPESDQGACAYISRQVAVKAAYELSVTTTERDAMARVLAGCPEGGTVPQAVEWPSPGG